MPNYAVLFDTKDMQKDTADVVIVGSGLAGVFTSLMLPENLKIVILTKTVYTDSNSYLAQGGIAAAIGKNDSPQLHYHDTLIAGSRKNDYEAVKVLVREAKDNIEKLMAFGVPFDVKENGEYYLGKEGAHSVNRILHSGDFTGKTILETLYQIASQRSNIQIISQALVADLLSKDNECYGVIYMKDGMKRLLYSGYTVIASGGIGRLFNQTTNAESITGDGIGMALRAGVEVRELDYVQYHPTVFFTANHKQGGFLISEAVRGEGAILRNERGEQFMVGLHSMADLAPRDIVARAIVSEIKKQALPHVYLDATVIDQETFARRFPVILAHCMANHIDPSKEYIPVAPMMHYFMGGIKVDLSSQTSMKRLFAVGECSNTGVHGKNRLASNSLLEAIVFGRRAALKIENEPVEPEIIDIVNEETLMINEYMYNLVKHQFNKIYNVQSKPKHSIKSFFSKFKFYYQKNDMDWTQIIRVNQAVVMCEMLKVYQNKIEERLIKED